MGSASATILSWITTEVDQALKQVREHLAKFWGNPEDTTVLRPCGEHLHQVSGALRMVGLSGATRFCEAIESAYAALNRAHPSAQVIKVIDRAVLALVEFVDGLERGQANVPLRLLPEYLELSALQGGDGASEKDLFFPDLALKAPAHADAKTLRAEEVAPFLQARRAQFQRGLLALLRQQEGGLVEMRQSLDALHRIAAQLPEPHALWWTATGLVDGIAEPPDAAWVARAKALCHKIDFRIRDLAVGAPVAQEGLLRDVLYAVATCKPAAPRIREIKQLYLLESLFPGPQVAGLMEFDMDWLQPALSDVRAQLEALKSMWLQYVSGEPRCAVRFRELLGSFRSKAGELGNSHLVRLLDAITLVAGRLPDPYPAQGQLLAIEMASAFLLAESVVENFTEPAADLEQQIGIMGGWLLDAAKGKSTGEPPAGLRADLSERIGAMQLRGQVAREIAANLRHVEQVLDGFARDPGKRDTLPGLGPYLRQIHGALNVLGFVRAAQILPVCENLIAACGQADHDAAAPDLDWIAEGLSSVGFFLDPCLNGRDPADQAVELFFRRYDKAHAPLEERGFDATQVLPPSPLPGPDAPPQPQADDELVAIFLEEAGEVLAAIDAEVPRSRAQPQDRDTLTTIRRGFHTLKGSGRMVGLMDLGEVAWEIEQVMNQWLEEHRSATPALLELIETASASFAHWVAQLKAGKLRGEIDGAAIVERARRLKTEDVAAPAPAPEPQPEPEPAPPKGPLPEPQMRAEETAPEPEDIEVGGVRLARSIFDIFINEAAQHAATLQAQCAAWRRTVGAEAPHEFVRAAHTLASSSRTAGFTHVAVLAEALEQWMPLAPQTGAADTGTVQASILALRTMTDALLRREAPTPAPQVLRALQALNARLRAPAPPRPQAAAPVAPARPVPAGDSGRNKRVMQDDIDAQLLPIFIEEAQQLLPLIGSDLRDLKGNPADAQVLQSLQRALHTLKGSARMAGAIRLGELAHIMESRIEAAVEAGAFAPALFAELEEKMDRLSLDLERMAAGPEAAPQPPAAPGAVPAEAPRAEAPPRAEPPLPSAAAMLRIHADTLDHLINESGEVSIARSRIEGEVRSFKQSVSDLSESIARLRGQLREVEIQADSQLQSRLSVLEEQRSEFDPLEFDRYTRLQELTRLMAESLQDAASIQQGLLKNLGETDAALAHQARISRDVQQELMRMRAVPFSILDERLYRIVRQTTRDLNKKAELQIQGSQVELDRSVLERIGAPLEHLLRNSLAHGIEAPAVRISAGKPESGRMTVSLRQESNEISLIVSDDGAGLDLARLRHKAEDMGLLRPGLQYGEAELMQMIFVSGLSTAGEITELAGRGIGMDVVKNEIAAIGGRIEVASTRGQGTTFSIYLPLTLAVTQAVLVRAGASIFAVPSAMVEQVLRLKSDALTAHYAAGAIEFAERSYPLHGLGQLLGASAAPGAQAYHSILLLRSGIQRVALHVDELVGNQEIVVKNIGPQLARVPGIAGATVLADGSIVLIVNPVQLVQHARAAPERATTTLPAPAPAARPVVMVVDDSLTVRKITSRVLEREGYRVLTAKDGVDALEQMKETLPAVMLVDIEMPRMDGFDLTRNVRGDPRMRQVPIIIISSRTADKHRQQAALLGVNAFLGKPYPEAELLQHIANLIAAGQHVAVAV